MASLASLEKIIETNIKKAWYQNGLIMLKIRDDGMYKKKYGTFENYLESRWEYSKQHGHRLINSAEFMAKLTNEKVTKNTKIGDFSEADLPKNEGQIRPLLTLENDSEKIHVWKDVIGSGEKVTAELVKKKVDEFVGSGVIVDVIDFDEVETGNILNTHVGNNSGENEWYTPFKFIDADREVMGSIDFDPASSDVANKTVMADVFCTKEDSGLEKQWEGNVWMNPPYAQPLMTNFANKLVSEIDNFKQAIVLVNNATETKWFQLMASGADCICFPSSRIKFIDPDGIPSGSPLQGQTFLYFGDNKECFVRLFSQFGAVLSHA